jgi:hypothetical protein
LNSRLSLLLAMLLSGAASAADPFDVFPRVLPSPAADLRPAAACNLAAPPPLDPIEALRSQ